MHKKKALKTVFKLDHCTILMFSDLFQIKIVSLRTELFLTNSWVEVLECCVCSSNYEAQSILVPLILVIIWSFFYFCANAKQIEILIVTRIEKFSWLYCSNA